MAFEEISDIASEAIVIGIMLNEPKAANLYYKSLLLEDFRDTAHRALFACIPDLPQRTRVVSAADPTTVQLRIATAHRLSEVPLIVIEALVDNAPAMASLPKYARSILMASHRRNAIGQLREAQRILEFSNDPDKALVFLRSATTHVRSLSRHERTPLTPLGRQC